MRQDSNDTLGNKTSTSNDEKLISLLEFEIEQTQATLRRAGWTKWGLWVAFAWILWLLIEQVNNQHSLYNSLYVALGLSVVYDTLRMVGSTLATKRENAVELTVRPVEGILHRKRPFIVYELFRCFALVYLSFLFGKNLLAYYGGHSFVLYTVRALLFFGVLLLSYANLALPIQTKYSENVRVPLGLLLMIVIGGLAIYEGAYGLISHEVLRQEDVLRGGGLLAAGVVVLGLIIRGPNDSPLLSTLRELRQEIALGHITGETANQRVNIAIRGMKASNYLQSEIKHIVECLDEVENSNREAEKDLERLKLYINGDIEEMEEGVNEFVRNIKETVKDTKTRYQEYTEAVKAFHTKVLILRSAFPKGELASTSLVEPIKNALDRTNTSLARLEKQVKEVENSLDEVDQ